jgi:hypothetical protein
MRRCNEKNYRGGNKENMNILSEVKTLLETLNIPIETGAFTGEAPNEYIVLVPLADSFPLNADDEPQTDKQELRISIFTKGNYIKLKNSITGRLITHFFYITDRRYNGYETDTGYHQYIIDVAKTYDIEEDN